ncbi:MAG: hypothetical protein WD096_10410 [Actinomycetota bacterium]
MRNETLKILVTVKAYPAIGKKHGEAVCVAGIDMEQPRWIRLFPVPFRDMPFDRRFRKFDVIEVDARKASDPRPESYQPNVDSTTVLDNIPPRRADDRRRLIDPLMQPSMCAIRRQQVATGTSLGVFRLAAPPELVITEDRSAWDPDKQLIVDQPSMLMPGKKGLEKVPYRFSYRYGCAGEPSCRGHEQSIVDWEIAEAFRSWRDAYGEAGALDRIRTKWTDQVWAPDRYTALFTGNQFKNPDGFLILGVFWPPRPPTGGGSPDPAQGELLPPR